MTHLLLRPALLLSGLLLLPVLLIHALPYDDGGLRDFLTPPEGCPAPCFMGIRPGVTTLDTLDSILSSDPWAVWLDNKGMSGGGDMLRWDWTEAVPAWLSTGGLGQLIVYPDSVDYIDQFGFETSVSIGALHLAFGEPDQYLFASALGSRDLQYYHAWYRDLGLVAYATIACDGGCWSRFHWPVTLTFQVDAPYFDSGPASP